MLPKHKTAIETHSEENDAEDGIIHRLGQDLILQKKGEDIVHLGEERIAGEDVTGDEIEPMMPEIEFGHGEVINERVFRRFRN